MQNAETCVVFVSTSTARQKAGLQLVETHQTIPEQVPLDAEALSDLFALESHGEPAHVQASGATVDKTVLVKGLDLGGVVVWKKVETLGDAAVEERFTAPCCALVGVRWVRMRDTGGSGRRTQVSQSPPQTSLQRPFSHLPDMVGVDTIGAATTGAATIGVDTTGAGEVGADAVGADIFGSSGGSASAALDTSCRRSNIV